MEEEEGGGGGEELSGERQEKESPNSLPFSQP